jgi:hypothetical protein
MCPLDALKSVHCQLAPTRAGYNANIVPLSSGAGEICHASATLDQEPGSRSGKVYQRILYHNRA